MLTSLGLEFNHVLVVKWQPQLIVYFRSDFLFYDSYKDDSRITFSVKQISSLTFTEIEHLDWIPSISNLFCIVALSRKSHFAAHVNPSYYLMLVPFFSTTKPSRDAARRLFNITIHITRHPFIHQIARSTENSYALFSAITKNFDSKLTSYYNYLVNTKLEQISKWFAHHEARNEMRYQEICHPSLCY